MDPPVIFSTVSHSGDNSNLRSRTPATSSAGAGRTKSAGANGSEDQLQGSKSRFGASCGRASSCWRRAARRLRYAVVASNMGFGRYVATLRVLDDDELDGGGCRISWAFECDAVKGDGWSEAALVARISASVEGMAEKIAAVVGA